MLALVLARESVTFNFPCPAGVASGVLFPWRRQRLCKLVYLVLHGHGGQDQALLGWRGIIRHVVHGKRVEVKEM